MDEATKEILLAAVIFFTVIANVLLVMTRRKVGKVSAAAEKAEKEYTSQFEEMAAAYKDLSEAHKDEIKRLRDQADADRRTQAAQIKRFEDIIGGMENMYKEESERWRIDRKDLLDTTESQGQEIKDLKAHNKSLVSQLDNLTQRGEERAAERTRLLAKLEASQHEIAQLRERILLLEAARNDETKSELAGGTPTG